MPKVRMKFNKGAIKQLLTMPAAQAMVDREGERVASACNGQSSWGGYHAASEPGGSRARARVYEGDARNEEARNQRLVRNL